MKRARQSVTDSATPSWIERRISVLKHTGQFCFSGEGQFDPPALSARSLTGVLQLVKVFDVSRTTITSIAGCPFFPRLVSFIADRSGIANLANFQAVKAASTISLKHTPVSKLPTYRVSVLLGVGIDHITSLDGFQISRGLKATAKSFSEICGTLVNLGWIATPRPPTTQEVRQICSEYAVDASSLDSDTDEFSSDFGESSVARDFEQILVNLKERHREVWRKGKAQFGLLYDDSQDLNEDVVEVLRRHHLLSDTKPQIDILAIIETMCSRLGDQRVGSMVA
jgi:hypothetical protein